MFSGFGSGARSFDLREWLALALLGGGGELGLPLAPLLDHGADHVLRPERLDALHRIGHVDDLAAVDDAEFVVVEKREFHGSSPTN